jgi:hypothetical protein
LNVFHVFYVYFRFFHYFCMERSAKHRFFPISTALAEIVFTSPPPPLQIFSAEIKKKTGSMRIIIRSSRYGVMEQGVDLSYWIIPPPLTSPCPLLSEPSTILSPLTFSYFISPYLLPLSPLTFSPFISPYLLPLSLLTVSPYISPYLLLLYIYSTLT